MKTEAALIQAPDIINSLLSDKQTCKLIKNKWQNEFEIMLGYSDSSKAMGMIYSRFAISEAMNALDKNLSTSRYHPAFSSTALAVV